MRCCASTTRPRTRAWAAPLLRLSQDRLHDREVETYLGDLTQRAGGVAILWDERESEIIRVLEAA